MDWQGVFPAITTPFTDSLEVDCEALTAHVRWLVDEGCNAIVPLGSLGEGATLAFSEKIDVIKTCVSAVGDRVPVVAAVSALSTIDAVDFARTARANGCEGLMVLPPYVYRGDRRETEAYYDAVFGATQLPCMLYNNPIAYGTDVLPERVAALAARHQNLVAIKESSADVRRVAELRRLLGDRIAIFVGVDDLIVESLEAGAAGWVAGLVNAFPRESVLLFNLVKSGDRRSARELYEWFLPLLRLDTVPKFVQLIKLVQEACGRGSARVRPPRLELIGTERDEALALIRASIGHRDHVAV